MRGGGPLDFILQDLKHQDKSLKITPAFLLNLIKNKQGKWRDYVSDLTATSKETKEEMCCVTDAVATVDLSDNTLAVFTQAPRKTIPSLEFEEDAHKHTCASA